jgi:hypothetical protein
MMKNITDIGSFIEVTPHDELWINTSEGETTYIDDRTPFRFRVRDHHATPTSRPVSMIHCDYNPHPVADVRYRW